MKRLLIIIIFIFAIAECQKYNDLNDLAIIKSIGISHNNEYTLYAEIIEEVDKNNIPQTKIIQTNGKTIKELFNNIKLIVNQEIYLSHIDLIILDMNLNNDDYENIIHYFLNHKEFRNDFLSVLSSDILNVLKNSKYDEIEDLIVTNKESKKIFEITFEEIIKDFLEKKEFILSKITYDKEIKFDGNYQYKNSKLERLKNEKDKN